MIFTEMAKQSLYEVLLYIFFRFCVVYQCAEAEYAYQRRKRVIPLMMEPSYCPDGWLGIILGSKLWMDFRKDPSVGIQQLIKEISKARVGMHSTDMYHFVLCFLCFLFACFSTCFGLYSYVILDFSFSCFSSSVSGECSTQGGYKRKGFAMEERRRGKMAAGYRICRVSDKHKTLPRT